MFASFNRPGLRDGAAEHGDSMRNLLLLSALSLAGCHLVPGTDAAKMKQVKEQVAAQLVDPDSAKFRNVEMRVAASDKGGTFELVCGEVNGRNKLGAYAGFRRFAAEIEAGNIYIDPQTRYNDADLEMAGRTCDSINRRAPTFSCPEQDRIIHEIATQAGFDEVWRAYCVTPS